MNEVSDSPSTGGRNGPTLPVVMTPMNGTHNRGARAIRYLAIALVLGSVLTISSQAVVASTGLADPSSAAYVELRGWPADFAMTLVNPDNDPGIEVAFREKWLPTYLDDFVEIHIAIDMLLFTVASLVALVAGRFLLGRAKRARVDGTTPSH